MLAVTRPLNGDGGITIRVTPPVSFAPAALQVRTVVDANDDNRSLLIKVESNDFSRISQIQLNGRQGPRVSVFDFRGVPAGVYDVTAVVAGPGGRRASAAALVKVVPVTGR